MVECPLCMEQIPETKLSLRRHIGQHLEEIALVALPQEIYSTEVANSDGDFSNNSEISGQIGSEYDTGTPFFHPESK
jgi:hypothetical protein